MRTTDLKCIKVRHETSTGIHEEIINWKAFEKAFLSEKWQGERRYGTSQTIFGLAHRRMTIRNPFSGELSRRFFTFPNSLSEAERLHKEYTESK